MTVGRTVPVSSMDEIREMVSIFASEARHGKAIIDEAFLEGDTLRDAELGRSWVLGDSLAGKPK